jgi:hypothetical protein
MLGDQKNKPFLLLLNDPLLVRGPTNISYTPIRHYRLDSCYIIIIYLVKPRKKISYLERDCIQSYVFESIKCKVYIPVPIRSLQVLL